MFFCPVMNTYIFFDPNLNTVHFNFQVVKIYFLRQCLYSPSIILYFAI